MNSRMYFHQKSLGTITSPVRQVPLVPRLWSQDIFYKRESKLLKRNSQFQVWCKKAHDWETSFRTRKQGKEDGGSCQRTKGASEAPLAKSGTILACAV